MAPISGQKRKRHLEHLPKKAQRPRKSKRASAYHSSSEDEEIEPIRNTAVSAEIEAEVSDAEDDPLPSLEITRTGKVDRNADIVPSDQLEDGDGDDGGVELDTEEDEDSDDEAEALDSPASSIPDDESASTATRERLLRKRNDPSAFASSITKILGSKLTTNQRSDPILSRSKSASSNLQDEADANLERKAKRKMRDDRRAVMEKGRRRDVLGLDNEAVVTGKVVEKERHLKKVAQNGVVKLFNAVLAAQTRGLETERGEKEQGTVGMDKRQDKVEDMGKKAFLDLLTGEAHG